jgi:tetratricopeptide (TPR) repeat protein
LNGEGKPNGSKRKRRERLFIPPPTVGLRGRPSSETGASSVLREYISDEEGAVQSGLAEAGHAAAPEDESGSREYLADESDHEEQELHDDEVQTRRLKLIEMRLERLERRIGDFENTCYSFLLHAKRLSDRAISFYEDVFGLSREDLAHIHERLGINFNNSGQYDKAVDSFRRVVEFDDRNAAAHFRLGVACDNAGNHREAIESYRKTISLDVNHLKAYYKLADIYTRTENLEEAILCLTKAVELAPGNAESHFRLGTTLSEHGRQDEAIVAFQQVLSLSPRFPGIHRNLGVAYERKGEHDKAIECFKKSG